LSTKTTGHVALLGAANSIHLQRWATALSVRGWRVSLITQHEAPAGLLPAAVQLHLLPHRGALGYFANVPALRRLLRALKPDLLHAHYASGYGSTAALSGTQPLLLSVWGSDVYDFPRRSPLHAAWLRRNLRAATALASTSQAMASQVRRLLGQSDLPVAVTPFGIDLQRFMPREMPCDRPPGTPLVIGTVKTLAPKYGIDLLLRAHARLLHTSTRQVAPRLLIVGHGPQRAELQALAMSLGSAAQVDFAGAVPHAEVPGWLRRIDVFVAASRLDSESFGVAVLEASACALPVVVSDVGGLPEVVVQGQTGVVVPREDDAALAAALVPLLADAALRQRLGAAGREHVRQHFEWETCVDRMLALYGAVCAATAR